MWKPKSPHLCPNLKNEDRMNLKTQRIFFPKLLFCKILTSPLSFFQISYRNLINFLSTIMMYMYISSHFCSLIFSFIVLFASVMWRRQPWGRRQGFWESACWVVVFSNGIHGPTAGSAAPARLHQHPPMNKSVINSDNGTLTLHLHCQLFLRLS